MRQPPDLPNRVAVALTGVLASIQGQTLRVSGEQCAFG
jgi:hypothetical protein